MMLSNEQVDLSDKEIDVALRLGSLPDSNLVARKLAVLRTQVYASPAYIERHGEPLHPDDLRHHRTLGMQKMHRNNHYFWPLSDGENTVEYPIDPIRSEEHTSELQSLMRISYAVFCLKKNTKIT